MKTLLIDSQYLCHRAMHRIKERTNGARNHGVIKGFLDQLRDLSRVFDTNHMIFCWDSANSLRKEMYPKYKVKRNDDKDELSLEDKQWNSECYKQFDALRNVFLKRMGFKNIYVQPRYESDDLIAMIVKNRPELDCIIVSRDNDFFQLLHFADMYDPHARVLITEADLVERYGIGADKWALVKAMAGCKSDCVEGIRGVGEPTAIKYITRHPKLQPHHKAYQSIRRNSTLIEENLKLVELPMKGAKLYKLYPDEFNFDRFMATSKEFHITWSQQALSFWRGFMEGFI